MALPFTTNRVQSNVNFGAQIFIDVRDEIHKLFHGDGNTPGFSFDIIHRKVDKTQRCSCWDPLKKEISSDPDCPRCSGSGWLTYDRIVKTVKDKFIGKELISPVGQLEYDSSLFFFEYTISISEEDNLIEVDNTDKGTIKSPVHFIKRYSIRDVELIKGNNGRVEYIRTFANKTE